MIEVGQIYEEEILITKEIVLQYAELTGDKNPIHINEAYAANTAFKKTIAHGMLLLGYISSILANKLPGAGTIYLGQNIQFMKPVFVGEKVFIKLEILSLRNDKPIAVISTTVSSLNEIVIKGEATVKYAV